MKSLLLLRRIRPVAVVGFGGYPTLPPVLAATLRQSRPSSMTPNAVMGRANRMLAPRVTAIATSFPGMKLDAELAAKATTTGNPVRPMVLAAAQQPYAGACARRRVQPADLRRQPGRARDGRCRAGRDRGDGRPSCARGFPSCSKRAARIETRVREAYARLGVKAEVAPFFSDLPARIAASHLVVSRSGASTVAELAAIGRPSILVPLPHALDQDQLANATVLANAGGAIVLKQDDFTPARLAGDVAAACRRCRQALRHGGRREIGRRASMPRTGSPIWCCAWRVW